MVKTRDCKSRIGLRNPPRFDSELGLQCSSRQNGKVGRLQPARFRFKSGLRHQKGMTMPVIKIKTKKPRSRFAACDYKTHEVVAEGVKVKAVFERAKKWAKKTGGDFIMIFIPKPGVKQILAAGGRSARP